MDADGWENVAWGGLSGLVRWFRETASVTWRERIVTLLSSVIGGVVVGKLLSGLVQITLPDVSKTAITACWIVAGLGSGILIQLLSHMLGDAASVVRTWASGAVTGWLDRFKKVPPDGPAPQPGPDRPA